MVLTTGGVGPTHDDVTFEAVADAFGDACELREEIAGFVEEFVQGAGADRSHPGYKVATVPSRYGFEFALNVIFCEFAFPSFSSAEASSTTAWTRRRASGTASPSFL